MDINVHLPSLQLLIRKYFIFEWPKVYEIQEYDQLQKMNFLMEVEFIFYFLTKKGQ